MLKQNLEAIISIFKAETKFSVIINLLKISVQTVIYSIQRCKQLGNRQIALIMEDQKLIAHSETKEKIENQ